MLRKKKKKPDFEDKYPGTARRILVRKIEDNYQSKVKAADRNLSRIIRGDNKDRNDGSGFKR